LTGDYCSSASICVIQAVHKRGSVELIWVSILLEQSYLSQLFNVLKMGVGGLFGGFICHLTDFNVIQC
jgi:hypothetical protein